MNEIPMATTSEEFLDALQNNKVDIVHRAIKDGFSPNENVAPRNDPPLAIAVVWGSVDCVNALIEQRADLEQGDERGSTPLIIAASIGSLECVKLLLKAGASAIVTNNRGYTALFEAVSDRTKEHLQIAKLLIEAGADVNAALHPTEKVPRAWGNVLINAADSGSPAMIAELVAAGADPNRVYLRGSALTLAVESNRPDNVAALLAAGADPSIKTLPDCPWDFKGMTPLEIAKAKKFKKIVALLEQAGQPTSAKPAAISTASVGDSWKRIEAALKKRRLLTKVRLNTGVSTPAIQKSAKQWSVTLPEDFLASYQLRDGQADDAEDLIPVLTGDEYGSTYQLLSLDEIDREWSMWKELVDGGEFEGTTSGPDKGIRDDWWHVGWIPFASNGAGDHICLDTAPAKGGKAGQVITMNHESSERRLLADSFAEWLANLAESLEDSI